MAQFAEPEPAPQKKTFRCFANSQIEAWYWEGGTINLGGPRMDYEDCLRYIHGRIRALKCMSDAEYVALRQTRCFRPHELEPSEKDGIQHSARAIQLWLTRHDLKHCESRLGAVVHGLPNLHGYAADQDHFQLRSKWGSGKPYYVNCQFAAYIPLSRRLKIYKEMRQIERGHERRRAEEREEERRAEEHPKLVSRVRELELALAVLLHHKPKTKHQNVKRVATKHAREASC